MPCSASLRLISSAMRTMRARRIAHRAVPCAARWIRALRDRARRKPGPPAPRAYSACRCARRAARRFRSSPGRCGGAFRRSSICDERAHIVQAVGELHQKHADVVRHRQHQFAEILRLLGALGKEFELGELGDAVDEARDLAAEMPRDLLDGGAGVLNRVVQQRRRDARGVELQIGEDARHFERMREIGIARGALLRPVRLHGKDIGLVEDVFVGARIIGPHPLDKFGLPHQPMPTRASWASPAGKALIGGSRTHRRSDIGNEKPASDFRCPRSDV